MLLAKPEWYFLHHVFVFEYIRNKAVTAIHSHIRTISFSPLTFLKIE